jgi:hypothetical protein
MSRLLNCEIENRIRRKPEIYVIYSNDDVHMKNYFEMYKKMR